MNMKYNEIFVKRELLPTSKKCKNKKKKVIIYKGIIYDMDFFSSLQIQNDSPIQDD